MRDGSKERGNSTWRLWPVFLLHLSSGLSGIILSNEDDEKYFGNNSKLPFQLSKLITGCCIILALVGSLTTLLIAHLATLELGNQFEFYVTLTGGLKISRFSNTFPCFVMY